MELNDAAMLKKISDEIQTEALLCYHGSCKLHYFAKYQNVFKKPETGDWATTRKFNDIARNELINFINNEILNKLKVLSIKFLEQCYIIILQELYENEKVDIKNLFTTNT